MRRVALAWALVAAAWAWTAALVLAPLAAAGRGAGRAVVAASLLVYVAGGTVCHQHPARTVHLWGVPMPVCARCTGLYAGAALGITAAVVAARRRRWRPLRDAGAESLGTWRIALIASAAPAAVTFAYEKAGGLAVPNGARLGTGLVLGAAVGWVVASSLRGRTAAVVVAQPDVD